MPVNKLQRFEEIASFDHVLEYTDFQDNDRPKPKGQWHATVFGNEQPITLELACGTGAYTVELARRNPGRNYVGIDIKGARLWKGAKQAHDGELSNVRFLRIFIDHLDEYFAPGEVDEIWITFPDPYPRAGDRNKRLSAPKFLEMYRNVLSPGGMVHFKTDNTPLFEYTCRRVIGQGGTLQQRVDDVYRDRPDDPLLTIQTRFEKKHLQKGRTIAYCRFTLP